MNANALTKEKAQDESLRCWPEGILIAFGNVTSGDGVYTDSEGGMWAVSWDEDGIGYFEAVRREHRKR